MSGLHFHRLRVREVSADTADACVVRFEPEGDDAGRWHFEPGQYLTLRAQIGGEDIRRSYSICAAPGEPLRVGVRRVDGGVFSNWVHARLRPGDVVEAMPPQGHFGRALARRPRHILAVAGGSGITPVLSVLKAHLNQSPDARATLVYANRQAASSMFKEELEDLKNRCMARLAIFPVFSREQVEAPLAAGHVDAERLLAVLRLSGGVAAVDEAFVCGPHAMNDDVQAALLAAGLAPGQVHVERFGVPPAARTWVAETQPGDAATARVTLIRDGMARDIAFTPADANLLAAAVRSGLDLPFSCRSGVCATCRARLLEGRVRMDRNFALEPDDLAAGFVLTCQAHPLMERVVVSFDER